jgi:hypothetical protein
VQEWNEKKQDKKPYLIEIGESGRKDEWRISHFSLSFWYKPSNWKQFGNFTFSSSSHLRESSWAFLVIFESLSTLLCCFIVDDDENWEVLWWIAENQAKLKRLGFLDSCVLRRIHVNLGVLIHFSGKWKWESVCGELAFNSWSLTCAVNALFIACHVWPCANAKTPPGLGLKFEQKDWIWTWDLLAIFESWRTVLQLKKGLKQKFDLKIKRPKIRWHKGAKMQF